MRTNSLPAVPRHGLCAWCGGWRRAANALRQMAFPQTGRRVHSTPRPAPLGPGTAPGSCLGLPQHQHPYLPQNHPICACLQSSAWVYLLLSAAAPVLFLSPSPSSVHPCRAVQVSCSQSNSSASSWRRSLPCSLRAIPFKLKLSSRSRP